MEIKTNSPRGNKNVRSVGGYVTTSKLVSGAVRSLSIFAESLEHSGAEFDSESAAAFVAGYTSGLIALNFGHKEAGKIGRAIVEEMFENEDEEFCSCGAHN